jgi:hypothetical protein
MRRHRPQTTDALHPSRAPEPDRYASVHDDDRYLPPTEWVAEHAFELGGLFLDVEVLDLKPASGVVLTGRQRVGSGVLAEDEHGSRHPSKMPENP